MDKMRMESVNITDQNIEKIGALFPNVITEAKDENGKLTKAINFELLKQELSKEIVDGDEAYEFTWVGKKAAIVEANKPIRKTLRPCKEESVKWDTTENLYIEGDNLEVLKLLQESYLGKVKMIYIDPPYNTGNDFIYDDDFRQSQGEYDDNSGAVDENGDRMFKNTDSNGRFHSDWLSMMYSRLQLARNLLSSDGAIFISIDDNEQANLKEICDEIFGESNFVNSIIWYYRNSTMKSPTGKLAKTHEYILVYRKTAAYCPFPLRDGEVSKDLLARFGKYADEDLCIRYKNVKNEESYLSRILPKFIKANGREPKDDDVLQKLEPNYVRDVIERPTIRSNDFANRYGFEFSNPKNPDLISLLIQFCSINGIEIDKNALIVDFFSGSATTAHAIMRLNSEDGGKRRFIMVQLPEKCDESSESFKAGYKNICEIGKERIRRAAKTIHEEHPGATFDDGFRVLKVDDSNMTDVYYSADSYEQNMLNQLESNIKPDRTDLDLLFGCLLEWGLPLSMPYASEDIEGYTVHTYNDGDLVACFNENIPESVIKEIAKRKPLRAVFRDSGFKGSPEKINVGETFKLLSPDTRVKII